MQGSLGDEAVITIRKYEDKDKQSCRNICHETSAFDLKDPKMKTFLDLMYNDYYTEVEGENCFVAVNENDEAVGYLLCAKDFDSYYKTFRKNYLPKIDKLGLKYSIMARSEIFIHKAFSKKYKAHLHIDLLDVCRHQGTGSKLMKELKSHLADNGCHSLMLSCGYDNKNAIAFYKRNGFFKAANVFGSYIMAIEF